MRHEKGIDAFVSNGDLCVSDTEDSPTILEVTRFPTASNYQVKIFEAVEQAVNIIMDGGQPRSMIIDAKPGSGKTTTGVAATRLIPAELSTIFVAFNKKIAAELATRLPMGIPAKTFHAQWLKQWGQHCWNMHRQSAQINDFKVKNAVEKHLGISRFQRKSKKTSEQSEANRKLREMAEDICFLVEKAKIFGVVPKGYSGAESVTGYEDNDFFWAHIMSYFNYQIEDERLTDTIEVAREILWEGLDNELEIDFNDMLYLPAVKQINAEQYDVVMIDEAQDLNGLQRYLLSQMVSPNGMIIAIGDKRQSIYAFRGADAESMLNIQQEFDCEEYPLSISYRCAKSIVKLAREIYDEIEENPDAPEGSVERPDKWKVEDFKPGHLIICRNNAPTVTLAYKLIKNQIPAKVLGRDIGEGLMKLVRKLDLDGSLIELMGKVVQWKEHQISLMMRKDPDDTRGRDAILDKYDCISMLCQNPDIKTVTDLLGVIDMMFTSAAEEKQAISDSRVTLSTIHKIKGAEADTVFILDSHLINPPWVRNDWQFTQEENLRFVAITRAKTRLVFINSDRIE